MSSSDHGVSSTDLTVVDNFSLVIADASAFFEVSPVVVQGYVREYGLVAIQAAIDLKRQDLIDFRLNNFFKIMASGFSAEEATEIYLAYYDIFDRVKDSGRRTALKFSVTLQSLVRLSQEFADFRQMPHDDKVEILMKFKDFLGKINKQIVEIIIGRAKDIGVSDMDSFLEMMADFADGSIFDNLGLDKDGFAFEKYPED